MIKILKEQPYALCDVCQLTTFAGSGTKDMCQAQAVEAGWRAYKSTTLSNKTTFMTRNVSAAYKPGPYQHVCPACVEQMKKPVKMSVGLFEEKKVEKNT